MRNQNIFVAFILLGAGYCLAWSGQSQVQLAAGPRKVVLESVNIIREPVDTTRMSLFIRVWSDKNVEYQKLDSDLSLMTATISDEQLSSLRQRLDSIDTKQIRDKTGPYNIYEHSSLEMQIGFVTRGTDSSFSVLNPFPEGVPGRSLRKGKRLPKNIKDVICECFELRAAVAHEPIYPFCDSKQGPPRK